MSMYEIRNMILQTLNKINDIEENEKRKIREIVEESQSKMIYLGYIPVHFIYTVPE